MKDLFEDLNSIKEQLFDAEPEVKSAFNNVVEYFSYNKDKFLDAAVLVAVIEERETKKLKLVIKEFVLEGSLPDAETKAKKELEPTGLVKSVKLFPAKYRKVYIFNKMIIDNYVKSLKIPEEEKSKWTNRY